VRFVCLYRAAWCTKASAYAESGKGSHHLVYYTQSDPVFTQDVIFGTWTRDLSHDNNFTVAPRLPLILSL